MQFRAIALALAVVGFASANDVRSLLIQASVLLSNGNSFQIFERQESASSEAPVLTAERIFWQSVEAAPYLELITETVTWT